jgi:hypothetical protein
VVDGSGAAFFVTVFAEKSKYTEARQKMHPLHHHKLLYIMCSYGLGRKPISTLCIKAKAK